MSLAKAREIAREWRETIRQGLDPKVQEERRRREEEKRRAETFGAAFEAYADDRLTDLRTGAVVKAVVVRLVYPHWRDRPCEKSNAGRR